MSTRTNSKTTPAVQEAQKRASIPKRPVIEHTKLFRAELQAALSAANNELMAADSALVSAADDRDMSISLANQKFEAIREGVDADRTDILLKITGIAAALAATAPASNVVPMTAAAE